MLNEKYAEFLITSSKIIQKNILHFSLVKLPGNAVVGISIIWLA
ncbi:uncharacterized protein METZ01_LOCUS428044 [marine metagenome]|uniref:Uncharacterized protein n=1 Tax=marine metagenome TaxID=408172 RepID=A0A382XWF4_9ZZZZ